MLPILLSWANPQSFRHSDDKQADVNGVDKSGTKDAARVGAAGHPTKDNSSMVMMT